MTDFVVRVLRVVSVVMFIVASVLLPSLSKAAEEAPAAAGNGSTRPERPGGAGAPTTSAATKSQCEDRVARLVGKSSAALRDPDVQALAKATPRLALCAAIVRDSDEPCDLLPADQAKSCRKSRSTYRDLRDPKARGYIFPDAEYQECKKSPEYASVCDPMRNAIRSGNPDLCPSGQPFNAVCRASITLNPELCPTDDPDCKKDIQRWKTYADGLEALKKSGSAEDRALAAAALGEADACNPIAKSACAVPETASPGVAPGSEKPGSAPPATATPGTEKPVTAGPGASPSTAKPGGTPAPRETPGSEKPGGTPTPTTSH